MSQPVFFFYIETRGRTHYESIPAPIYSAAIHYKLQSLRTRVVCQLLSEDQTVVHQYDRYVFHARFFFLITHLVYVAKFHLG